MAQTALYDGDGPSDGAELPGGVPGMFEPPPALPPEGNGCGSARFVGDDVPVHACDGCWMTVRARSAAALEAGRDAAPGDWGNG